MSKLKLSLINIAEIILKETKEPVDIYSLFDKACEEKELSKEEKKVAITQFYSDITTSAKFVYVGENTWDLKANQKADLWEKDGSFYKEYTKIDLPDEYKDKPKPKKAKAVKAKVAPIKVVEEPVVEEVIEEVIEEAKPEVVVEAKPEVVEGQEPVAVDPVNPEDELFEGFDEEKYNEYMDNYEDQYDK